MAGTALFFLMKKFNFDSPDGFAYYWHDIGKDVGIFSKRQGDGNSLMTWAAFSEKGKTDVAILDRRHNAQKYVDTLQSYLIHVWPVITVQGGHSSRIMSQFTQHIIRKRGLKKKIFKLWNGRREVQI